MNQRQVLIRYIAKSWFMTPFPNEHSREKAADLVSDLESAGYVIIPPFVVAPKPVCQAMDEFLIGCDDVKGDISEETLRDLYDTIIKAIKKGV